MHRLRAALPRLAVAVEPWRHGMYGCMGDGGCPHATIYKPPLSRNKRAAGQRAWRSSRLLGKVFVKAHECILFNSILIYEHFK